jgi:hypothetical protein
MYLGKLLAQFIGPSLATISENRNISQDLAPIMVQQKANLNRFVAPPVATMPSAKRIRINTMSPYTWKERSRTSLRIPG